MINKSICLLILLYITCFSSDFIYPPKLPKVPTIQEMADSSDIIITLKVKRIKINRDFYVGPQRVEKLGGVRVDISGNIEVILKGDKYCKNDQFISFHKEWKDSVVYDSLGKVAEVHTSYDRYKFLITGCYDLTYMMINQVVPDSTYLIFLDVDESNENISYLLNGFAPAKNICELVNYQNQNIKTCCDTLNSKLIKEIDKEIKRLQSEMMDSIQKHDKKH